MKNIIHILTLITFFILTSVSSLDAKDVFGKLSQGEGSSFVPAKGSAFSIISDLSSGIYDGRFDIVIKNGGKIIYEERDQVDDLYLVFNESVDEGDYIKLDVKKGVFIFRMTHMSEIPDVIANAIKSQAPAVYDELKPLHKKTKKRDEVVAPKKVVAPVKKSPPPVIEKPLKVSTPKEDSRVIKRHISPEVYKKEIAKKVKVPSPSLPPLATNIDKFTPKRPMPTPTATELDKISSSIDTLKKENVATTALENSQIEKITNSAFEKASAASKVSVPTTKTSGVQQLPSTPSFNKVARPSPSATKNSSIPQATAITPPTVTTPSKQKKELPHFSSKIEPVVPVLPTSSKITTGKFKTSIETNPVQAPSFTPQNPDVIVKRLDIDKVVTPPSSAPVLPSSQANMPKPVSAPKVTYKEPEIVAPKPVVVPPVKVKTVTKPYVARSEVKDKIVITKTIVKPKKSVEKEESRVIKRHVEPEDYKREQQEEQIPMRMADRVLGNGYGMATPGRLKVKAYSNNRPVSAWVEVFKADTKQRVKTFYTGKGRSLKDIKLPAGVYVIKATYRTAGSKRKKTVGRITLDEGGSISKSISFNDGAIKVIATKHGEPFYAKVEVYKSGKSRRIAYAFTSKKNGKARINIGSGTYDIVVRDHNNVRRFDNIRIRGSKTKTFHADF